MLKQKTSFLSAIFLGKVDFSNLSFYTSNYEHTGIVELFIISREKMLIFMTLEKYLNNMSKTDILETGLVNKPLNNY